MLVHYLRCLTNIKPALGECLVFDIRGTYITDEGRCGCLSYTRWTRQKSCSMSRAIITKSVNCKQQQMPYRLTHFKNIKEQNITQILIDVNDLTYNYIKNIILQISKFMHEILKLKISKNGTRTQENIH